MFIVSIVEIGTLVLDFWQISVAEKIRMENIMNHMMEMNKTAIIANIAETPTPVFDFWQIFVVEKILIAIITNRSGKSI